MEAPERVIDLFEIRRIIRNHVTENYAGAVSGCVCKKCGSEVMQATGYAFVHMNKSDNVCAETGTGKIVSFPLPFCPKCEGEPHKVSTCCVYIPFSPDDSRRT